MNVVSEQTAERLRASAANSVLWTSLAPVRTGWRAAEKALGAVTHARQTAALDDAAEAVILESGAAKAAVRAAALAERAWHTSAFARSLQRYLPAIVPERWLTAAWGTAIAMLTVLTLRLAVRSQPLGWLLPFTVLVTAGVAIFVARGSRRTPGERA